MSPRPHNYPTKTAYEQLSRLFSNKYVNLKKTLHISYEIKLRIIQHSKIQIIKKLFKHKTLQHVLYFFAVWVLVLVVSPGGIFY